MRAQIHRNTDAAQIGAEITAPLRRRRRILTRLSQAAQVFVARRRAGPPY